MSLIAGYLVEICFDVAPLLPLKGEEGGGLLLHQGLSHMRDSQRMTVDEFFEWHSLVEGRYELVDGHIVPHPDYFGPHGFAAPDTAHARICANITLAVGPQLMPPCRIYVGAGAIVDRAGANVPNLSISCSEADNDATALAEPCYIFEVSSPKTTHIDTGRKVADYLAVPTLRAYVFVDRARRSVTIYRPDAGPQTFERGALPLGDTLTLTVEEVLA